MGYVGYVYRVQRVSIPLSYTPTPDYSTATLWRKLMGEAVFNVSLPATAPDTVRVYSHCLAGDHTGSIVFLLMNLEHDRSASISLNVVSSEVSDLSKDPSGTTREEYHMTPPAGEGVSSRGVALNGVRLASASAEIKPKIVQADTPVVVAPLSYAFVSLQGVEGCL
jgi:heparanase 1